MAFTLSYNGSTYEISDGDAGRIEELYKSKQAFGPELFTFNEESRGGTIFIAVGTGIPLALHTGDD